MIYQIITASNAVGSLVALSFLVSFLHKKEYSKFYQAYIILQCSGLALLLLSSVFLFNKTGIPWVMSAFGLVYWVATFVFITSMKIQFGDTDNMTKAAKKLSDDNIVEAQRITEKNIKEAKQVADDRYDNK